MSTHFRLIIDAVLAVGLFAASGSRGFWGETYASDRGLPFVTEAVEEICVVTSADSDHKRVVFLDDKGRVITTRLLVDEMQWVQAGDGFQLIWQDYWTAERVVEAKRLTAWNLETDPTDQSGLCWFDARRRMTDLRQP